MKFGEQILQFLNALHFPVNLKNDVEVLNPFNDAQTIKSCSLFYHKYYNDHNQRRMILGINPGRFGGGITGIPFTDPIRLDTACGIKNEWMKKQELSSVYIYDMIKQYGGPFSFYKDFYITSVSPLGFTKNNKNLNYYDDRELQNEIKAFVMESLHQQLNFGIKRDVAFCLGHGKNYTFLNQLNNQVHFFEKIIALPHPRFIMQYKLKKKDEFIAHYLKVLNLKN